MSECFPPATIIGNDASGSDIGDALGVSGSSVWPLNHYDYYRLLREASSAQAV